MKLRPRLMSRVVGACGVGVSAFFASAIFLAPHADLSSIVVFSATALAFFYIGYCFLFGNVVANERGLVINEGFRSRHVAAEAVQDLELCDAGLYVAGQRTIGVRSADRVTPIRILARYPTRRGIQSLESQIDQLRLAILGDLQ